MDWNYTIQHLPVRWMASYMCNPDGNSYNSCIGLLAPRGHCLGIRVENPGQLETAVTYIELCKQNYVSSSSLVVRPPDIPFRLRHASQALRVLRPNRSLVVEETSKLGMQSSSALSEGEDDMGMGAMRDASKISPAYFICAPSAYVPRVKSHKLLRT